MSKNKVADAADTEEGAWVINFDDAKAKNKKPRKVIKNEKVDSGHDDAMTSSDVMMNDNNDKSRNANKRSQKTNTDENEVSKSEEMDNEDKKYRKKHNKLESGRDEGHERNNNHANDEIEDYNDAGVQKKKYNKLKEVDEIKNIDEAENNENDIDNNNNRKKTKILKSQKIKTLENEKIDDGVETTERNSSRSKKSVNQDSLNQDDDRSNGTARRRRKSMDADARNAEECNKENVSAQDNELTQLRNRRNSEDYHTKKKKEKGRSDEVAEDDKQESKYDSQNDIEKSKSNKYRKNDQETKQKIHSKFNLEEQEEEENSKSKELIKTKKKKTHSQVNDDEDENSSETSASYSQRSSKGKTDNSSKQHYTRNNSEEVDEASLVRSEIDTEFDESNQQQGKNSSKYAGESNSFGFVSKMSKSPRLPQDRLKAREAFTGKSTLSNRSVGSSCSADGSEAVNVVVRVRPLSNAENQRRDKSTTSFPGDGGLWIEQSGKTRSFSYNVTFEPSSQQEDVFNHSGIKKLVEMAVDGYSCTAFAYGQTGSGKTYTMTGPPEQKSNALNYEDTMGLIPRCFRYLFQILGNRPGVQCRVTASYLEIYNEQVKDLLNPNHRSPLAIRLSSTRGFYVENLFAVECECIEDLFAVLEEGMRNRAVGSNAVNEYSSRSHSMLTLNVASRICDENDEESFATKLGKLTFVDLAGSEKTKSTGANNVGHLNESNNINRSLLVLGTCISALGDKRRQGHVPYRDSKLTKLLADSLKGNGVTLMVSCISPSTSSINETMNTLRYASRTRHIKAKPVVIMDPREKFILSLKREIKILRQENHYLRQQLNFPVKPKGQLQRENDDRFLEMLREQRKEGKPNEPGLYEMIQEYMIENDMLRGENTELHQAREVGRREIEMVARENEKLIKKLEKLGRSVSISPTENYSSLTMLESDSSFISISKASGKNKDNPWLTQQKAPNERTANQPVKSGAMTKKPPHHLPPETSISQRETTKSTDSYSSEFKKKKQPLEFE